MNQPKYTVIHHEVRKKFRITTDEYCLADSIDKLSNKIDYPWCLTEKKDLGKFIGISERTVYRMTAKLAKKGIIESDGDGNLRTTPLWAQTVTFITTAKMAKPTDKVADNSNTNNSVSKDTEEWTLSGAIKKLDDSPRRELNVIALYFKERRVKFSNKGQFNEAIRRHIRAAKSLIHFSDNEIIEGCEKAKEKWPNEWTLETANKMLTK